LIPSQEEIELRGEERRALILLGITAIFASIYAAMLASVWAKVAKPDDFFVNFPWNSPIPHGTILDMVALEWLIRFWVGYAFFAFWYFCVDVFPGPRGIKFRNVCHAFAKMFLGLYVIYLAWFIPVGYFSLVWIPDAWQGIYWYFAFGVLTVMLWLLAEWAVGKTGFLKSVVRFYSNRFDMATDVFEIGLTREIKRQLRKH